MFTWADSKGLAAMKLSHGGIAKQRAVTTDAELGDLPYRLRVMLTESSQRSIVKGPFIALAFSYWEHGQCLAYLMSSVIRNYLLQYEAD